MKKAVCIIALLYWVVCLAAAQNELSGHIIYNELRPLQEHEQFVARKLYVPCEAVYRFVVSVAGMEGNEIEKVFECRYTHSLYMFEDNKRFIVHFSIGYKTDMPEPAYYIDGEKGNIEFLGLFYGAYAVLEENMIIIDRDPSTSGSGYSIETEMLIIYSITDRTIYATISLADVFLKNKAPPEREPYFYVSFLDYYEERINAYNGYVPINIRYYGKELPESFDAYLNINDVKNIRLEYAKDTLFPVDTSDFKASHRTIDNLRLRYRPTIEDRTITTLKKDTTVQILKMQNDKEIIDGITAPWARVLTQNGYIGWCFSGYLEPLIEALEAMEFE
jgi:hypothetical protein